MKNSEMAELFGIMMIAYPNAKMFERGIAPLKATIELWTRSLPDVDYWTGQQAMYRCLQELKFPPTIAEFKARTDEVKAELNANLSLAIASIRTAFFAYGQLDSFLAGILPSSPIRLAIDAVGGADNLRCGNIWTLDEFSKAFIKIVKSQNMLPADNRALPGAAQERKNL